MEKQGYASSGQKLCLSLGFFDCMHGGHREIVAAAAKCAKSNGLVNSIFTFDTGHTPLIKGDDKQVYTYLERLTLFESCGIERVISYPFDDETKNTEPLEFLSRLTQENEISAFVCGNDYTFGKGGVGNVALLKKYCTANGIELIICPKKTAFGEKISTTRIKALLRDGSIEKANALLQRPYFICGPVVRGRGEGHLFGIPTANVWTPDNKLLPKKGVYACLFFIDGVRYKAVVNVGDKPTFGDYTTTVEALIGDFNGDIYGKTVTLEFIKRLRETKSFESPLKLAEVIKNDLKWE